MATKASRFTDSNTEEIFGAEDAEGEPIARFKEYFVANKSYEKLTEELPIRILVGHKGVGKSALLKRAFLEDEENGRLAVFIQPGDVDEIAQDIRTSDFNRLIEAWKRGIIRVIAKKAAEKIGADIVDQNMSGWAVNLTKGISSTVFDFLNILKPSIGGQIEQSVFDRFSKERKIYIISMTSTGDGRLLRLTYLTYPHF